MAAPVDLRWCDGRDGVGILAISDLLVARLEQGDVSVDERGRGVAEEGYRGVGAGVAFDGVEGRAIGLLGIPGHEVEGEMAREGLPARGGEVLREAQHGLRKGRGGGEGNVVHEEVRGRARDEGGDAAADHEGVGAVFGAGEVLL